MSYINQKRRLLAGILALLLLVIVVFMSCVGYSAIEIREQIEMSREFKNKSIDVNIVETINEKAESVTFYTSIFMLFVLLFGLFLIYEIRKLGQEFTLYEICVNCKEGGKLNDE